MKILLIHPYFSIEGIRGSELIVQETFRVLKKAGHDVYFFATNKKPFFENAEWTKYFPTFYPKFNIKKIWNIEAQDRLAQMLDDTKPDVVNIHGTQELTYSIYKPIFYRNIPVIMTVHDSRIICPAGNSWNKKSKTYCKKCQGINTLPVIINNCSINRNKFDNYKRGFVSFIQRVSGYNKRIAKFITPSQALADYIQCEDIPDNKINVVPNFLSEDFLNKIQFSDNKNYFLYVGTLADYKGVNTLLDAIKELPSDILFKIVGSGPEEENYKNFVRTNGLHNVEFLGNLDRYKIIKYYSESIATIVPSEIFESFGMVSIEAFACHVPIIASKIGGIPEIVEHNKTGLLFDPANVEQLKECIMKYWNNPNLVIEHGKNAYEKAKTQYTEEKYYENLIKIFEEVISESK